MISFDDDLSDFRRDDSAEDVFGPTSSSSSKLASLFEDDSAAAPVESKPAAKPKTLLLYTANKAVLTQLPLSASFPLSLAPPYVYFTAVDGKKWSIAFDDDDHLRRLLAWYLLITDSSSTVFTLNPGVSSGPIIEEGDALLVGITVLTVDGEELKITEEPDVKLRLSAKKHKHDWERHLPGLRKGAVRMIYASATVTLLTLKKVRQRETESETRTEASDLPKDTVPDPVPERESEQVSTHEELIAPEATVLQRMAKLGKPMLGLAEIPTVPPSLIDPPCNASAPTEEEESVHLTESIEQSTVPQETATVAQPTAVIDPPPVPQPSYADFHRVVGLEMDRLQIRLESSFSRMLQEALGPIKDQLSRLEARQDQLLQTLQTPTSDNSE